MIGFVGLCLLVGAADTAVATRALHGWYLSLNRPSATPPGWLYPVAWGVLYPLVGFAAWLVWRRPGQEAAVRLWGWHLLAAALWPCCLALRWTGPGALLTLLALTLGAATALAFVRTLRISGVLLLPHLAWTCYATYVTAGFWLLNPG